MKTLKNLSPATKMIILIVYTFVLLAISVVIISASSIDETKGYGPSSRDENIQIVSKLVESRVSNYLNASKAETAKKEKSTWVITIQLAKNNPEAKISNIGVYVKAKNEADEMVYFEETGKSNPNTGSQYFLRYTSNIKKENTYVSTSKTYKQTSTELKMVYITARYILGEGENQEVKELKYYYVPTKPNQIDFNDFQNRLNLPSSDTIRTVYTKNDYHKISIASNLNKEHSTEDKTVSDVINFRLECNEKFFQESEKFVTNGSVTVFAKVKNDPSDTENFFEDYITVVDLHGTFVNGNNKSAWTDTQITNLSKFYSSDCSIDTTYEVSQLYVLVSYTLSDGKTAYDRLVIDLVE